MAPYASWYKGGKSDNATRGQGKGQQPQQQHEQQPRQQTRRWPKQKPQQQTDQYRAYCSCANYGVPQPNGKVCKFWQYCDRLGSVYECPTCGADLPEESLPEIALTVKERLRAKEAAAKQRSVGPARADLFPPTMSAFQAGMAARAEVERIGAVKAAPIESSSEDDDFDMDASQPAPLSMAPTPPPRFPYMCRATNNVKH